MSCPANSRRNLGILGSLGCVVIRQQAIGPAVGKGNLQSRPRLSIVIPAYNESRRLPRSLRSIAQHFEQTGERFEVIVVDDGSLEPIARTGTPGFAPGRLRILRNRSNRGKGASVRRGVAAAKGEWILFTDADLSTPIWELNALEKATAAGADVASASRAAAGARVQKHQPFYREFMGRVFGVLVRLLVLPEICDTQCGFKLFRRETAREIFERMTITRFGFDVEILFLAKKLGARIAEVPVEWHNSAESKVSPLRDAAQMFLDLFRIRIRHRGVSRKAG